MTSLTLVSVSANVVLMGLLLRHWRERRGWSLRDLGERSGVSYVTIQRIEAGILSPTVATLEKIAAALGISVREFFPPGPRTKRKEGQR